MKRLSATLILFSLVLLGRAQSTAVENWESLDDGKGIRFLMAVQFGQPVSTPVIRLKTVKAYSDSYFLDADYEVVNDTVLIRVKGLRNRTGDWTTGMGGGLAELRLEGLERKTYHLVVDATGRRSLGHLIIDEEGHRTKFTTIDGLVETEHFWRRLPPGTIWGKLLCRSLDEKPEIREGLRKYLHAEPLSLEQGVYAGISGPVRESGPLQRTSLGCCTGADRRQQYKEYWFAFRYDGSRKQLEKRCRKFLEENADTAPGAFRIILHSVDFGLNFLQD